jgi:hypothetical protein
MMKKKFAFLKHKKIEIGICNEIDRRKISETHYRIQNTKYCSRVMILEKLMKLSKLIFKKLLKQSVPFMLYSLSGF